MDGLLLNHRPLTRAVRDAAGHVVRCQTERSDRRRLTKRRHEIRQWRMAYANRWRIAFNRLQPWEQQWAYATGACESGNNPRTATGNGFWGSHQWLLSTWGTAVSMFGGGWPSNPIYASYHHQAYVAVRWMHYAGASQWPNCG